MAAARASVTGWDHHGLFRLEMLENPGRALAYCLPPAAVRNGLRLSEEFMESKQLYAPDHQSLRMYDARFLVGAMALVLLEEVLDDENRLPVGVSRLFCVLNIHLLMAISGRSTGTSISY